MFQYNSDVGWVLMDPLTAGAASGAASSLASAAIQKLRQGENAQEEWREGVFELATMAQSRTEYYLEAGIRPQKKELRHDLETIGKQARKLTVLGRQADYPATEVELAERLSEICARYSTSPGMNDNTTEDKLQDSLDEVVPQIFELQSSE
jgi:hypothetical protein